MSVPTRANNTLEDGDFTTRRSLSLMIDTFDTYIMPERRARNSADLQINRQDSDCTEDID